MKQDNIYDPEFVEDLFNRMSASYARMNYITSFGFSVRWRRQLAQGLGGEVSGHVVDLMTGMGECWDQILKHHNGQNLQVTALDFSKGMLEYAKKQRDKKALAKFTILNENLFNNSVADNSADHVVSGFGLKTFSTVQLHDLALEIKRMLKPGGSFSLVDVSVPSNYLIRVPFMFYLKRMIPILGKAFLGNPETYKMLGIYTELFGNSKDVVRIFNETGLNTEYRSYFGGCASGVVGVLEQ